jgi:hypothetical protein
MDSTPCASAVALWKSTLTRPSSTPSMVAMAPSSMGVMGLLSMKPSSCMAICRPWPSTSSGCRPMGSVRSGGRVTLTLAPASADHVTCAVPSVPTGAGISMGTSNSRLVRPAAVGS